MPSETVTRKLNYGSAINEAFTQLMKEDKRVFVLGVGINSPWYIGNTTGGLVDTYGQDRVIDTPVSENSITGIAIGAAAVGMRPVIVHPRHDFLLLAFDQVFNHAAISHYMSGGTTKIPLVIRAIINRGAEQSAQHSKSLQSIFAHVPGVKIVMPSTPYDAKGLLISSIYDGNLVIYIDDRWLYSIEGEVPEEVYKVPIGKAAVRREGKDLTLVTTSYMSFEATGACEFLEDESIDVEHIDLRTVKPIDKETIFKSVEKTGRLIIADSSWPMCGIASEISALVSEHLFNKLKSPIERITLPEAPAPASRALEKIYYPSHKNIIEVAKSLMNTKR
jgi:pyruvate dehydrogenase E1 component beta subunit